MRRRRLLITGTMRHARHSRTSLHHVAQPHLEIPGGSHLLAQAAVQRRDVLAQVDNVLDGRVVVPAQAQDGIHEVLEAQALLLVIFIILCENDVDVLDETRNVDADLLQCVAGLLAVDDVGKLLFRDRRVPILVDFVHDLRKLLLDEVNRHFLPLSGGHGAHHLAEDSDEHVQHRERRQKHEEVEQPCKQNGFFSQRLDEVAQAVHDGPI
mmetsp:Transcript_66491/g.174295  ORF Transcript_66491/g.174295 Transcript_66491/m.174295 type:complete len:210 (-) Transcript_66491:158-787(-)